MKLTPEQVKDIVRYCKAHAHPRFGAQRHMAEKYGVRESYISRIMCGEARRDVTWGMGLEKANDE